MLATYTHPACCVVCVCVCVSSVPLARFVRWFQIVSSAKNLKASGKNLSGKAYAIATALSACLGLPLLAFGFMGMNNLSSIVGAVGILFIAVVYLVASHKLLSLIGKGSDAARTIGALSRKVSGSFFAFFAAMVTFTIVQGQRNVWGDISTFTAITQVRRRDGVCPGFRGGGGVNPALRLRDLVAIPRTHIIQY